MADENDSVVLRAVLGVYHEARRSQQIANRLYETYIKYHRDFKTAEQTLIEFAPWKKGTAIKNLRAKSLYVVHEISLEDTVSNPYRPKFGYVAHEIVGIFEDGRYRTKSSWTSIDVEEWRLATKEEIAGLPIVKDKKNG